MRDALIVGIDTYSDSRLNGCVRDAQDIAACLSLEQYGFDCTTILSHDATRRRILEKLGSLCYGKEGRDTLVFYFAGHGQFLGDHGHIVSIDGSEFDPGISLSHLGQLMESASSRYRHVIAILDCCHSGAALTWTSGRPLQPRDVEREMPGVNESRCVLAACRPEELAFENGTHGYFTAAALEGLLGDAVNFDGEVTLLGLYDYISGAVPTEVQTTVFKGDVAGTVVLATGWTPRVGRPIGHDEKNRVLARAQNLLDEHYILQQREFANHDHKVREGARQCALRLEPKINWFDETEAALPDVRRDPAWRLYRKRLLEFQAALADVTEQQVLSVGKVVRHLGRGGYGHVWCVKSLQGEIAVKIFHGNELDDSVKTQRFKNGYENMRQLSHPRIVEVRQLLLAPFGLVMDYIPGENLRHSYLDRDDRESLLRLLVEIAETVSHAHDRGVRHRDIKPENIILLWDESGKPLPYLTDFDLAYHETNRTITTNLGVGGVINYAAPEQFYMPNTALARAETVDVYGFAQLLFFVIVGRDPVADSQDENIAMLQRTLSDWVDARAAENLLRLYASCSERDASVRLQTMREVLILLTAAENIVLASSGRDDVSIEDFLERLAHLYAGLGNHRTTEERAEMASLSGQVNIAVRNRGQSGKSDQEVDLEIELSAGSTLPINFLTSGAAGRKAINSRLDRALRRYPNTTRHAGSKGVFQTFVHLNRVPLTLAGLDRANQVLGTAVSSIEQW
ncbi:MAG: protein kinase domain-containing protein [Nocardioides sp.]